MWRNIFSLSGSGQNVSKSQSGFEWRKNRRLFRCRKMQHNLSDVRGCVSSEVDLHSLTTALLVSRPPLWLSLSIASVFFFSQEVQAGPAKKVYMSQCPGHQSGPAEPRFGPQRQRCQPGWAHTALSELLWSVAFVAHVPKVRSLSQPGYINEMREGKEGIRGEGNQQRRGGGGKRVETKASLIQSSFVLLDCRGQLVTSMQHLTNPRLHWLSITLTKFTNHIFL